jgi:hypothetical protein
MNANLVITARSGTFDVAMIRDWLDARPDMFEDPCKADRYFMCGYPSFAMWAAERRYENPDKFPGRCVAYLAPQRVLLNQEMGDATDLRSSMDFLIWLTSHFDCQIRVDGYGDDLTERVAAHGAASLYDDDIRNAPLPWAGTLIGVGFFRELYHGDTTGSSLELARQPEAIPDEAELVRYLESGELYRRAVPLSVTHPYMDPPAGDSTYDVIAAADLGHIDLGPPHQLTDGVYVWPADLAYYLRTYHVRLPRPFIVHARRNGWRVPEVDVASLPAFEV